MGQTQRALTSLVAAIPAGVLTYLLVMVFLSRADTLKLMMQIVAGVTLLCSGAVTLMPIGLLVLGGRTPKGAVETAKPAKKGAKAEEFSDEADLVEDSEEVGELEEAVEASDADIEESEEFVMEESDVDIMADSGHEIESRTGSSLDEIESLDYDDEDEEPKPKKKKK